MYTFNFVLANLPYCLVPPLPWQPEFKESAVIDLIMKVLTGNGFRDYGRLTAGEPLKVSSLTWVQERPCPPSQASCVHL